MMLFEEQQAQIIEFGRNALAGGKIENLYQEAVSSAIATLQVEHCEIAQIMPNGEIEIGASISRNGSRVGDSFSFDIQALNSLTFSDDLILFTQGDFTPLCSQKNCARD